MEKQSEIQKGSIVHLKSGSPDLKVVGIIPRAIMVGWVDDGGGLQHDIFPSTSLVVLDSETANNRD